MKRLGRSRKATAHSPADRHADRVQQLQQQMPDATAGQCDLIASVEPQTMTSPERILALCEAVEYLVRHRIEGDLVECGVWRGGSMAAVAKTLIARGVIDRQLWLYDTFEGMSDPTGADVDFLGRQARTMLNRERPEDPTSIWCYSPLDEVRGAMEQTGYPEDRVTYVPGDVLETLPQTAPDRIALLRLDTDWYESTRCELETLFPKVVPGGVLIVDDYGHWEGCRRAVDEYFTDHQIPIFLHRIDYTGRMAIVPAPVVGT